MLILEGLLYYIDKEKAFWVNVIWSDKMKIEMYGKYDQS